MKQVIKNYSMSLGYQLVVLIIPFISIPYLSRVLGPNNLGIEAYVMSITAIYIAFATAGTSTYSIRQVAMLKNKKSELLREVYNILLFRGVLSLGLLVIFILLNLNSEYATIFLIQIIFFLGSTLLDCTWYFIGKEQFKLIILRNLSVKIIGIILILIFVNDEKDLDVYLWVNALTILVPNLYLFFLMIKEIGRPKRSYFSMLSLKKLTIDIMPFFILGIVSQMYMNVDKIIVESKNLIEELGFYNQFLKSYNVFLAPITAVGAILMPRLSSEIANEKDQTELIKFSSNFIFLLCMPIVFGLMSISNEFVIIFYGNSFAEYVTLFQFGLLLIFTGSLSNLVVQQIVFPNKLEKIYVKALLVSTVIRIFIVIFLVEPIGIYAAMLAYIVSEILLMTICIFRTRKVTNVIELIFNKNNFKILFASLMMFLFLFYVINQWIIYEIFIGILLYFSLLLLLKETIIIIAIDYLKNRVEPKI